MVNLDNYMTSGRLDFLLSANSGVDLTYDVSKHYFDDTFLISPTSSGVEYVDIPGYSSPRTVSFGNKIYSHCQSDLHRYFYTGYENNDFIMPITMHSFMGIGNIDCVKRIPTSKWPNIPNPCWLYNNNRDVNNSMPKAIALPDIEYTRVDVYGTAFFEGYTTDYHIQHSFVPGIPLKSGDFTVYCANIIFFNETPTVFASIPFGCTSYSFNVILTLSHKSGILNNGDSIDGLVTLHSGLSIVDNIDPIVMVCPPTPTLAGTIPPLFSGMRIPDFDDIKHINLDYGWSSKGVFFDRPTWVITDDGGTAQLQFQEPKFRNPEIVYIHNTGVN